MHSLQIYQALKVALEWQNEIGVEETIGNVAINRYEHSKKIKSKQIPKFNKASSPNNKTPPLEKQSPSTITANLAQKCHSLEDLRNTLARSDFCTFKDSASNLVFNDGKVAARIMVIGNPPDRDENRSQKPFSGAAGKLFDKMFQAIGFSRKGKIRDNALYLISVIPWRPPKTYVSFDADIAAMKPFLAAHVRLVNPDIIVLMGNISYKVAFDKGGMNNVGKGFITAFDKPTIAMFHPKVLLRDPRKKADAWKDLLEIKARINRGN